MNIKHERTLEPCGSVPLSFIAVAFGSRFFIGATLLFREETQHFCLYHTRLACQGAGSVGRFRESLADRRYCSIDGYFPMTAPVYAMREIGGAEVTHDGSPSVASGSLARWSGMLPLFGDKPSRKRGQYAAFCGRVR